MRHLKPQKSFQKPNAIANVDVAAPTDVHHLGVHEVYGQTGVMCGFRIDVPAW